MNIRSETPADVAEIHALHAACFPSPAEARLVDELRADGDLSLSLVASDGAKVVGHVAFSPVTVPGLNAALGLAPVAVLASHRRRGIAAHLIQEGLRLSLEGGTPLAVVLGDPAYYARFGFVPAFPHGLSDEYGGGNAFQVLELAPHALSACEGTVRYAAAFARLAT